jgi:ABC-type transporter Mla maintaining outer membrane lipid asymmetry ATPase subunit MlaF
VSAPLLALTDVSKAYGGLRPLRLQRLALLPGESMAILGFDQAMAEVFVNLATGASLPDSGAVEVFGRPTSAIADSAEWLTFVDRFGIVSERAVMLEQLTVVQNLALPFTLDIEPPSDSARRRAMSLAREVGLLEDVWDSAVSALPGAGRAAARLARALALDPAILLLEHPTASVDREDVTALGRRFRAVAAARGVAALALTADEMFAAAFSSTALRLDAANGRLTARRAKSWFR